MTFPLRSGRPDALNQTHVLLRAYAESTGSLTVAGTVRQFTDWYAFLHGVRIPERTFKDHTRKLQDAGLISVRHTGRRTWYTLLQDEIKVPVYEFVPVAEGESRAVQVGMKVLRHDPAILAGGSSGGDYYYDTVDPQGDYGVAHDDIDLDALQASWPDREGRVYLCAKCRTERCEHYPDGHDAATAPAGTVAAAGCWSCRIVRALGERRSLDNVA
jgi:hypothetical protein